MADQFTCIADINSVNVSEATVAVTTRSQSLVNDRPNAVDNSVLDEAVTPETTDRSTVQSFIDVDDVTSLRSETGYGDKSILLSEQQSGGVS